MTQLFSGPTRRGAIASNSVTCHKKTNHRHVRPITMQFNRGSTGVVTCWFLSPGTMHSVCINQNDVDVRNAHIMRIREIYSKSLSVAAWLGEGEMSNMDLNSWVGNSFDNLRRCGTILEAHGRPTLEAALGIDVGVWESDRNFYELKDFPFSSDVLYFDNEWWADSDDEEEFGPPPIFGTLSLWHSGTSFRIWCGLACG